MHTEAHQWVQKYATSAPCSVLDIGGRNINGSVRDLFPAADPYVALDIAPGEGVDIVANAATWVPGRLFDFVVCAEVFEHTWQWPEICTTAFLALAPKGLFIVTTAGPGRPPHSGVDGEFRLLPGEYYANVDPAELKAVLIDTGFRGVEVDHAGLDVRAVAVKPGWVLEAADLGPRYSHIPEWFVVNGEAA